jgi:hypothetical protein
MVKVFESTPNEISGDLVSGGTIRNFTSTGIQDHASMPSLVVTDGKIAVSKATIGTLEGNTVVRGDLKVYGILDAGMVRTTEILTNQRYEKQYLEFASPEGNAVGTGLLWIGGHNKQLVLKSGPDRFWMTENVDLPANRSYMINEIPVVSADGLGPTVVNSHLTNLGVVNNLRTRGELNFDNYIHYNPTSQRVGLGIDSPNGLFEVFDYVNNVEVILDSNKSNGYGKVGTFNTRGLEIVTDDTARITISENGNILLGTENKDSTVVRVSGKLAIGIKNPSESLEVAGNLKFSNRLFTNGNCAPISGSFKVGDIVWNTNPRSGSYIGWVCVSPGSPGVWQTFGLIS